MKNARRLLAVLLSVMMLTTLIPMSAFAASVEEAAEIPDEYVDEYDVYADEVSDDVDSADASGIEEAVDSSSEEYGNSSSEAIEEPDEAGEEYDDTADVIPEDTVEEAVEAADEEADADIDDAEAVVPESANDTVTESEEDDADFAGLEAAKSEKKDYSSAGDISLENAESILLDEWKYVQLDAEHSYKVFQFEPSESGQYAFYSNCEFGLDTYGHILNADGEEIAYNDDGASNVQYYVTAELSAGEVYYLVADAYSAGSSISFSTRVIAYQSIEYVFDANGGFFEAYDSSTVSVSVPENMSIWRCFSDSPVREGFSLIGWAESADSTETIPTLDIGATEGKTFFAVWAESVEVTFDLNGGHGEGGDSDTSADVREVPKGERANYSGTPYVVREGYTLVGWAETADATESVDLSFYNIAEPKTFYAMWAESVEVTFDLNGGHGEGGDSDTSADVREVPKGERANFTGTPYVVREGYELVGWAETADATEPVDLDGYAITEPKTFYAVWAESVEVTFDPNGGHHEYNDSDTSAYVREIPKGASPDYYGTPYFVREGYAFVGWAETADATESVYLGEYEITGPKTFYAVWEESVEVTFDPNGGHHENDESDTSAVVLNVRKGSSSYYELAPYFVREGYALVGWGETADATESVFLEGYTITAPTTLYAIWAESVEVTFDPNGGYREGNASDTSAYVREIPKGARPDYYGTPYIIREGYTFIGWAETEDATESVYLEDYVITEPKTFYAVWAESVEVTFDPNGGHNEYDTSNTSAVMWGVPKGARPDYNGTPSFAREGYILAGWAETTDATEAVYLGGYEITEPKTFYAVWVETVEVTFDPNGGHREYDDSDTSAVVLNVQKGTSSYYEQAPYFVRDGYALVGWGETADATEPVLLEGYDVYEPTTLYAIWSLPIPITFDANGGYFDGDEECLTVTKDVPPGKRISSYEASEPECEGCRFLGWALTADSNNTVNLRKYKAESPMTFYAVWEELVTITYDGNGGYYDNGEENLETVEVDIERGDYLYEYSAPTFRREGMVQAGWSTSPDGEMINKYDWEELTADEPVTYYAVWAEAVTIKFDGNGGYFEEEDEEDGSTFEKSYPKDEYIDDYHLEWFYRSGYTLIGWAETPEGPAVGDSRMSDFRATESTTYYAVWEKNVLITFDPNGGYYWYYGDEEDDDDYEDEDDENGVKKYEPKVYEMPKGDYIGDWVPYFENDGFYREGWSESKDGPVIEDFYDLTAQTDKTYYAIWAPYLNVTFHANNSAALIDSDCYYLYDHYYDGMDTRDILVADDVEKGDSPRWYAPTFSDTPPNMVFAGWALNPDATMADVLPNDYRFTGDTELYAIWVEAVKVTFNANGGKFKENDQETLTVDYKEGDLIGKRARVPILEEEGKHFFGYATSPDATVADIDLEKDTVTDPATYYAVWRDAVTATFHLDPEDPSYVKKAVQIKGEPMKGSAFYEAPGDSDHIFTYWSTGDFGGQRVNLGEYVINEDTDFYANFNEIYTVYLYANGGYFATEDEYRFVSKTERGKPLSVIPSDIPTSFTSGMVFSGWYDDDGDFVTDDLHSYIPTKSTWLYAKYVKDNTVKVESVTITPDSVTLEEIGATAALTANVLPEDATNKTLTWQSSDPDVATVDNNGVVTAVEEGTATITAIAKDGSEVQGTAAVTVTIPSYGLTVENGTLVETGAASGTFRAGAHVAVTAAEPEEGKLFDQWTATPDTLVFENDSQASATATIVMPAESVTLTATYKDKPVDHVSVTSVTVSPASKAFSKFGDTEQLSADVQPENATVKTVEWKSSNTAVATVSETGLVTAVAEGTATITATAADGSAKSGSCSITVELPRYAFAITNGKIKGTDKTGGNFLAGTEVTAVANAAATGKRFVRWEMTGNAEYVSGTAVNTEVTIRMPENDVTLTAVYEGIKVKQINVSAANTKLTQVGETTELTAEVLPANAENKELSWESSDSSVATVDTNGKVTAVKSGIVTISAKAKDGSGVSAGIEITIEIPEPDPVVPEPVHTHSWVTVKGKAATCTAAGLTDGKKCSGCGKIHTAQKTIKALGHSWSQYKVTKAATTTATGVKVRTCTRCGKKESKVIPMLAKKAQSLTVAAKKPSVKASKLKKKKQTVAKTKAFKISNAQGAVTFTKTGGSKKLTISSSGKITVKKKTKKGTYKIKVLVSAAGNNTYLPASKEILVKVKVK